MSTPIFEIDMDQGADFDVVVNWYGAETFRAPIEEIDPGYPTKIRVSQHLLPSASDTPIIISGVVGAEILNSRATAVELCKRVDDDHFTVPVSTVASLWEIGTGEITYRTPSDIASFTAIGQIRSKWHSGTLIKALTTTDGSIVLDADDASISIHIPAAETQDFEFTKAYCHVELISPGGAETRVFELIITFNRGVIRGA
jgi:hypothetical protein